MDEGKVIRDRIEWKGEQPPEVWPDDPESRKKVLHPNMKIGYQPNVDQAGGGKAEMGDPTREEFDAKLAAAEARTQTLLAQIDGKIDRLSDAVARMGGELGHVRQEIADSRREWRQEAGSLRWWIVGTGLAIVAIVVGILAYGLASLQIGIQAAPPQISVLPITPVPVQEPPLALPPGQSETE